MWGDQDILAAVERRERAKKNRAQYARTCNACKKRFPSGNQLFKHLEEHPLHRTELHYISYTVKCKNCDHHDSGHLNVKPWHLVPVKKNIFRRCNGVYAHSVEITPYYHAKKRYSIMDFDPNDIVDK